MRIITFLWGVKMEEDKKIYKYMSIFAGIIGVVVVAQLILANYLQAIY
tara:strand:+ start:5318 stop:5461 length:144 start_codon:yes stop_codon:yes gene_type:complete